MSDAVDYDVWKRHLEWRRSITKGLPEIAMRVFALREKMYRGCGFHYSLERTLGRVIAFANTVDDEPSFSATITDQMAYETLLEHLTASETSVME